MFVLLTIIQGSEGGRVGREVESSPCGIDETTGQCTPGDNDICRQPLVTAYRNSVSQPFNCHSIVASCDYVTLPAGKHLALF